MPSDTPSQVSIDQLLKVNNSTCFSNVQSMLALSVIFEVIRYQSSALGGQAYWHRHRMVL